MDILPDIRPASIVYGTPNVLLACRMENACSLQAYMAASNAGLASSEARFTLACLGAGSGPGDITLLRCSESAGAGTVVPDDVDRLLFFEG